MINPKANQELVREMVIGSTTDFFHSVGLDVEVLDTAAVGAATKSQEVITAVINVRGGPLVYGVFCLEGSVEFLRATNPLARSNEVLDITDHLDWIGECANQIIGMLKTRFVRYGVKIVFRTPWIAEKRSELKSQVETDTEIYFKIKKQHVIAVKYTIVIAKKMTEETDAAEPIAKPKKKAVIF